MGGIGSGGPRVGSGPRPMSARERRLGGNAGRRRLSAVAAPRPVEAVAAPRVAMPAGLPDAAAAVWTRLAPHAREAQTLTPYTADALADLCAAVAARDQIRAQIARDGWVTTTTRRLPDGEVRTEQRKHALATDLVAWERIVMAGLARFRLAPVGKELLPPSAPPDDPFAVFDRPPT
jgi:phage terminase small subunit